MKLCPREDASLSEVPTQVRSFDTCREFWHESGVLTNTRCSDPSREFGPQSRVLIHVGSSDPSWQFLSQSGLCDSDPNYSKLMENLEN